MRQYHIPGVGKLYTMLSLSALYLSLANSLMLVVTLWQTTVAGWAVRNLPWLTLPIFIGIAGLCAFTVMFLHWQFVEPSRNAAVSKQAYLHDNPAVQDLRQIRADVEKIKAAMGVKD